MDQYNHERYLSSVVKFVKDWPLRACLRMHDCGNRFTSKGQTTPSKRTWVSKYTLQVSLVLISCWLNLLLVMGSEYNLMEEAKSVSHQSRRKKIKLSRSC